MTDQAAPIPETPEPVKPFTQPFRLDKATLESGERWRVVDANYYVVSHWLSEQQAQWLCDRLNATPTVNARAAAEEIITQIHGKLFSKHLGSQAKVEVAAIIAKHFATPAQPAPAEGGLLSAAEWHEAEAARLQSIPFTEITLSQANRWQLHLEAANAFRRRSALAAQGERAGLTDSDIDTLKTLLVYPKAALVHWSLRGDAEESAAAKKDYDALESLIRRLTGAQP